MQGFEGLVEVTFLFLFFIFPLSILEFVVEVEVDDGKH